MPENSLPIAVVVGPGGLAVAQLLTTMRYQTLLALGRKPVRRQLRKFLGVSTIIARPGELPLPDQCVDLVVIAGGLNTESPLYAKLAQLARVLKPGAMLLALTPEPGALHAKLWLASASIFSRKKSQPITPEQLTGAFLQAGLTRITQDKFSKLLPITITAGRATHASQILANYFSAGETFVAHSNHEETPAHDEHAPAELPHSESY